MTTPPSKPGLESAVLGIVRQAREHGAWLSQLGYEVSGLADWIECQVPKLGNALRGMARTAIHELTREDPARTPSSHPHEEG